MFVLGIISFDLCTKTSLVYAFQIVMCMRKNPGYECKTNWIIYRLQITNDEPGIGIVSEIRFFMH